MVWAHNAKNNRGTEQTIRDRIDRRMFCLTTEASIPEEPGAVVPHAGIGCATKGTKVMEEGPPVGAKQVDPPNSPMLLWSKAMVVSN